MARKPAAYPELIRAGDWRVHEWKPDGSSSPCPCTDNAGLEMWLPYGNGEWARDVRFHELLHEKYSPAGVPDIEGASIDSLQASEDCRVNHLGQHIRPHDALGSGPKPDPLLTVTRLTERGMARLAVASLGYGSSEEWLDEFSSELSGLACVRGLPDWLRRHARTLSEAISTVRENALSFLEYDGVVDPDYSTFDNTIELAKWLDGEFSDESPVPKQANPDAEEGEYDERPGEGGDASQAEWSEMSIETPPLTVTHPNRLGRRTTACKEGSRIGHWDRLVTGEIFGRTRKRAVPDVVLIDQSGSMHWSEAKQYELVKQMPVGTIAGYSGNGAKNVLRILARDGRMVAPDLIQTGLGGNEIDGPALRWLAKQKGRKVWVSDQGVCSDACSDQEALLADCNAVVRAAGIKVCLTTDPKEIMRALRGR